MAFLNLIRRKGIEALSNGDAMSADRVVTAGRVVYDFGRHHRWGSFEKPFDELDLFGLSDFLGIIEQALAAADAAAELI